jgi:phosphoribosylanthranilate isomerase
MPRTGTLLRLLLRRQRRESDLLTWIKICGTTNPEDAAVAIEAGADALGFIFAPSLRRVSAQAAREVTRVLPQHVERVGVFVNEAAERVLAVAEQVGLTAVQLHGDEDAEYVRRLRAESQGKLRVFKAVAAQPGFEVLLNGLLGRELVDGVLLDSAPASANAFRGGGGRTFDWRQAAGVLESLRERVRVVVGGGLSPANVQQAIQELQPWGVDVCSGVEREPGRKDAEKVRAFVAVARAVPRYG